MTAIATSNKGITQLPSATMCHVFAPMVGAAFNRSLHLAPVIVTHKIEFSTHQNPHDTSLKISYLFGQLLLHYFPNTIFHVTKHELSPFPYRENRGKKVGKKIVS
jgi:hypothetical protein